MTDKNRHRSIANTKGELGSARVDQSAFFCCVLGCARGLLSTFSHPTANYSWARLQKPSLSQQRKKPASAPHRAANRRACVCCASTPPPPHNGTALQQPTVGRDLARIFVLWLVALRVNFCTRPICTHVQHLDCCNFFSLARSLSFFVQPSMTV